MKTVSVSGRIPTLLVVAGLVACQRSGGRADTATGSPSGAQTPAAGLTYTPGTHASLLYGRVITKDGVVREGRLRWGGDQEALWSNYFNGVQSANPWSVHAPKERSARRPFLARFGDIARIELRGRDIQIRLKSGTVFHIARYGADDMNDGVRVWNDSAGFVDISEWGIRTIEFLPTPALRAAAAPLYGTVRTRAGDFTGLIQWDRKACLSADELTGAGKDGIRRLRFDSIRSITRRSADSSLVTLLAGASDIVLSGRSAVASGGIYVDDPRYGRVLVSSEAFARVDFTPVSTAPAYPDFQPGRPLMGDIITRSGRRLSGRLVFDLDESETTETLDAPSQGVDYLIPFGSIASIVPGDEAGGQRATVTLRTGEVLRLDRDGDLHKSNAGMLVFIAGRDRAEHVPWTDVERIDFQRPQ